VKFLATEDIPEPVALGKPVVVLISGTDPTTEIDVSWGAVAGAGSYKVEYHDGTTWQEVTVSGTSSTLV
jgi:hypothetical protein